MDEKTEQTIHENLLKYLSNELNDSSITYKIPPTQITGGQVTDMYKFQVGHVPDHLKIPLVLRIFPKSIRKGHATKEGIVQNALKKVGYPVPSVFFICEDDSILDSEFIIMEFMSGKTLGSMPLDGIPEILAKLHVELHKIEPYPIMKELGIPKTDFYLYSILDYLEVSINRMSQERLKIGLDWLNENRPSKAECLVACHGDFHPSNILYHQDSVSAVLDWGTFRFEEPAYDVACTRIVLSVLGPVFYPMFDWDDFVSRYFLQYQQENALVPDKVDFFDAVRLLKALYELDYGLKVWRIPKVEKTLIKKFEEISDVKINSTLY
jgi:aminoglycoside phosphotransferase (APT) family kinase protein